MKGSTYKVRHGGLMRCCIQSLDQEMSERPEDPKEGDRHTCQYCKEEHGMIFRDGAWEWAAPRTW